MSDGGYKKYTTVRERAEDLLPERFRK